MAQQRASADTLGIKQRGLEGEEKTRPFNTQIKRPSGGLLLARSSVGSWKDLCQSFREAGWRLMKHLGGMVTGSKGQTTNKASFILHFCSSGVDICHVTTGGCGDSPDIRAVEYTCQMGTLRKTAGTVSDQIRADNVE